VPNDPLKTPNRGILQSDDFSITHLAIITALAEKWMSRISVSGKPGKGGDGEAQIIMDAPFIFR
jgi:hypothetical protein